MKLYDKHFIHKVYDESLKYVNCLVSNDLKEIKDCVDKNYGCYTSVYPSHNNIALFWWLNMSKYI